MGRRNPADVADWQSNQKFDLVFSNATLHWIQDHRKVLGRLFDVWLLDVGIG
jgi:trans-aconitate methyltransferase